MNHMDQCDLVNLCESSEYHIMDMSQHTETVQIAYSLTLCKHCANRNHQELVCTQRVFFPNSGCV